MLVLSTLSVEVDRITRHFAMELDLSAIHLWGTRPFATPVQVAGTVTECAGGYRLEYEAVFRAVQACSRCLTEVQYANSRQFVHVLESSETSLLDEDTRTLLTQKKIPITQIVGEDLLLDIEDTILCTPDCKGLCPVCGGDRNKKACDCKVETPGDSRFDVLRQLLEH